MYPNPTITSHPNGMRFTAFENAGTNLTEEVFYSIGGGFIVSEAERTAEALATTRTVPYPFRSSADLLTIARKNNLTIAELILRTKSLSSKTPTSPSTAHHRCRTMRERDLLRTRL